MDRETVTAIRNTVTAGGAILVERDDAYNIVFGTMIWTVPTTDPDDRPTVTGHWWVVPAKPVPPPPASSFPRDEVVALVPRTAADADAVADVIAELEPDLVWFGVIPADEVETYTGPVSDFLPQEDAARVFSDLESDLTDHFRERAMP